MFLAFLIIGKYRCIPAIPALSHGTPSCWPDTGRHMSDLWDRIPDRRSKRNGRCSPASPLHQACSPALLAKWRRGQPWLRVLPHCVDIGVDEPHGRVLGERVQSLFGRSVGCSAEGLFSFAVLSLSIYSLVPARLNIKYLCFIIFHN